QTLGTAVGDFSLDHARINADFPEVNRNDANSPSRLSDHDPAVAYFRAPSLSTADLVVGLGQLASIPAGTTFHLDGIIQNVGPNAAVSPGIGFAFGAALPDLTITPPPMWQCDAPQIANQMTSVSCSAASLPNNGGDILHFALQGTAPVELAGEFLDVTVAATSLSDDPDPSNNQDSRQILVTSNADLQSFVTGPSLLTRNSPVANYRVRAINAGPTDVTPVQLSVTANVPRTAVSLEMGSPNWTCSVIDVPLFQMTCFPKPAQPTFIHGTSEDFYLTILNPGALRKPTLEISSYVSSNAVDQNTANNASILKTRVVGVTGF
ncbi:MAG: hypothetical protein ABJA62_11030, partial [Luteimonas sp.]